MKCMDLVKAIGGIDDDLIENANKKKETPTFTKGPWIRWGSVAAAVVLVAALSAFILPGMIRSNNPTIPIPTKSDDGGTNESSFEKAYTYRVDNGKYSMYVQGKVIADQYVGEKLGDVTVTAGWENSEGTRLTEEHANAEIFAIDDISTDVAVAIRFTDKLEAELTTCYYVILNPTADLTPVKDYVIVWNSSGQNDGLE